MSRRAAATGTIRDSSVCVPDQYPALCRFHMVATVSRPATSRHSPRCRTQSRQVPKMHLRRRVPDDATRARLSPQAQQRAGAAPAPANLDGIYTFQLHRARHFPEMPTSSRMCLNARRLHRRPRARTPTAVCLIHARYPSPRCPARTRAPTLSCRALHPHLQPHRFPSCWPLWPRPPSSPPTFVGVDPVDNGYRVGSRVP